MKKILVYGTLREGFVNYQNVLSKYKKEALFRIKGFKMYDLGGYPMIMRDKKSSIVVEEFHVEDEDYTPIHRMEIGAGYNVGVVTIQEEEYKIFFYNWLPPQATLIEGGDYKEYIGKKYRN